MTDNDETKEEEPEEIEEEPEDLRAVVREIMEEIMGEAPKPAAGDDSKAEPVTLRQVEARAREIVEEAMAPLRAAASKPKPKKKPAPTPEPAPVAEPPKGSKLSKYLWGEA